MQSRSLFTTIIITLTLMAGSAAAAVKIRDLSLEQLSDQNRMTIKFTGKFNGAPELVIRDKMLQVALGDAIVWPRIEKKARGQGKKLDTTLMAYQFDKQLVRVRALLPYSLKYRSGDVDIKVNKKSIVVTFPRITGGIAGKTSAASYDESYLAGLVKDKMEHKKKSGNENSRLDLPELNVAARSSAKLSDEVKVGQSALEKKGSGRKSVGQDGFLLEYIAKFVIFLGVVLGIFYGMMGLFKRGVLKRGNFNFLDNSKLVTVLNTTYIAPKRSLMLVKVNQQVFMLGSSESGINLISEIDAPASLLKDGEQVLSGSNFDAVYDRAEIVDKSVKLKEAAAPEMPAAANGSENNTGNGGVKEQIKNRLKNIKSLQ